MQNFSYTNQRCGHHKFLSSLNQEVQLQVYKTFTSEAISIRLKLQIFMLNLKPLL